MRCGHIHSAHNYTHPTINISQYGNSNINTLLKHNQMYKYIIAIV